MMRYLILCVAMSLAASMPAFAGAPVDRVKLLLEYKQAKALFATPFEDLQQGIERRSAYTPITDQRRERILQIGEKIYIQDNIFEVLVAAYAAFADPQAVEAEIKMFQTPAGQTFAGALADEATPGFDNRVAKYWRTKNFAEMKANRKNSIGSFMKQTKQAEPRAIIMTGMDIAVDLSLNAFKRRRYRKSLKTIKYDTRLRKNNYVMEAATETLKSMAFAMRKMKTLQIDLVTRFYYSRSGEQAVVAYRNALEVTMDRAGQTLMHNLNPDTKKPIDPPAALAAPTTEKNTKTVSDKPKTATEPKKATPGKGVNPKGTATKPSILQPKK